MPRRTRTMVLAALWFVPLLLFTSAFWFDWISVWAAMQLPSMTPHFADLRSITGGLATVNHGGDPLVANPHDPWNRPFNYPRIWLRLFSFLGINDQNISIVGLTFCVLYLICITWLIAKSKRDSDASLLLLASLSLAPLLAFERGNNDLLIFFLVFLGCLVASPSLTSGLFAAAALLKIYPFAALLVEGIRRPLKQKALPLLGIALVGGLFGWQWRDINAIRHATPASRTLSYGALSLMAQGTGNLHQYVLAACAFAGVLTLGLARFSPFHLEEQVRNSMAGKMFSVFGGVYVFTFLSGSNWDYRLIFLLPTLPLALEMARSPRQGPAGAIYIGMVILAENSLGFGYRTGTILCDFATVGVFLMIFAIFLEESKRYWFSEAGTPQGLAGRVRTLQVGD